MENLSALWNNIQKCQPLQFTDSPQYTHSSGVVSDKALKLHNISEKSLMYRWHQIEMISFHDFSKEEICHKELSI